MSAHATKIVRHDVGGNGTRFEARCSCGWSQETTNQEAADALAVGHRGYSPNAVVIICDPSVTDEPGPTLTAATITDDQLRELFARHCECRPLDLSRIAIDHAAIHDCDTMILHDVQIALGIIRFDDRVHSMREARARCAEVINVAREGR